MDELKTSFTWIRLSSAECNHDLLVRVEPRGDGEAGMDQRLSDLVRHYLNRVLYEECRHEHNMAFNGVTRLPPVGVELSTSAGGELLRVWFASSRVPGSSHQLGTAENEPAFWSGFAALADEQLKDRVMRPAQALHAFLLTDAQAPEQPDSV